MHVFALTCCQRTFLFSESRAFMFVLHDSQIQDLNPKFWGDECSEWLGLA